MGHSFTIGKLSRTAGLSPDAIRYYERLGILKPVYRTASQYRAYDHSSIERLRFVRRAQDLGLTLDDIGELVAVSETIGHPAACQRVERRLRARLEAIETKIAELTLFRRRLNAALSRCKTSASSRCQVLVELTDASRRVDRTSNRVQRAESIQ